MSESSGEKTPGQIASRDRETLREEGKVDAFLNILVSSFAVSDMPGKLLLEGSYAKGTEDQYSDIDISFVLETNDPSQTNGNVLIIMKTLGESIYILNYGETQDFPGYYYILATYKELGLFKIFDLCIRRETIGPFRGKEKLLTMSKNTTPEVQNTEVAPPDPERDTALFYLMQPGLIKKILRGKPAVEIRMAFEYRIIKPLLKICTDEEITSIRELLEEEKWTDAFLKGLELFEKKSVTDNKQLLTLIGEVQKLSQLI